MAHRFDLTAVDGQRFTWTVDSEDIVSDAHGHVYAFTVRFDGGRSKTFALGNTAKFVSQLLSTPLDQLGGAGGGATLGSRYGAVGTAIGAAAGWIISQVAENVILSQASYYDEDHQEWFRGVVKL